MSELTREKMIESIRAAGVVGAGGGGFPTHVKVDAKVELVIANGAECEPLVRVDQQEMAERPGELLRGMQIVMAITGASEGVIGLKRKYTEAIARLEEQIRLKGLSSRIRLHPMDNYYPAGDEFVLVREVTGKVIPEFGLPLHVGVVVSNVATLMDVAGAVDEGRPVTHRLVTVAGAVTAPGSFRVPVGTPLSSLVQAAGGATVRSARLVLGGPMMGALVEDEEQPVTKTTSMIIVLSEKHPVVQRRMRDNLRQLHLTRSACLKCMMCTEVCPRNLLGHRLYPDRLMRSLAADVTEDLEAYRGATLCSECGLCSVYGCVMNLDPAYMNREMKKKLAAAGVERPAPVEQAERVFAATRKVPTQRLVARLGLSDYDREAPVRAFDVKLTRLRIPLKQHAGAPARAVVRPGQVVAAGDLLGEIPDDALGARVHTGLAGTVSEVNDDSITMELG
ncbi:MAG: SLBB domain-containing protein [Deltaproteobacteria bacterium]|nr:SLBB domain-containing protein [Deltaproteobacteria bacterium]